MQKFIINLKKKSKLIKKKYEHLKMRLLQHEFQCSYIHMNTLQCLVSQKKYIIYYNILYRTFVLLNIATSRFRAGDSC